MAVVYRFRPKITEDNVTFDGLYGVEHDEMERINSSIKSVFGNNFIQTANLDGVRNFERIYEIRENTFNTLEERRAIVYNEMIYKPPFTRQRLKFLLDNVLGEGNYQYRIDPENFTVVVSIVQLDRAVYNEYIKKIRDIIPANMYLIPSTPYTYLYLSGKIYGSNRAYTNVGEGNGDYIKVSDKNYIYVGTTDGEPLTTGNGKGNYTLADETDFTNDSKLGYYTYRELSQYSVFDTTLELYSVSETETIVNDETVTSTTQGEIVPLAGAGIDYVSEM